jgi:hypothetical protein
MRPRRGFGVVLDGEDGQGFVPEAGDCRVVEVDVRDLDVSR